MPCKMGENNFHSSSCLLWSCLCMHPPAISVPTMTIPTAGDRILILKWQWLQLVLDQRKKMEIRALPLRPGRYFLGFKKNVYGWVDFGDAQRIIHVHQWNKLRSQHMVPWTKLPYKRTYGLPILRAKRLSEPVSFFHPQGAVGIVRMR